MDEKASILTNVQDKIEKIISSESNEHLSKKISKDLLVI
jgi:hypothetical protein